MDNTDRIFNINFPDSLDIGNMDWLVNELLDMLRAREGGLHIPYYFDFNEYTNLLNNTRIVDNENYIRIYRNRNGRKITIKLHETPGVGKPFELIDYYYWISHILKIYASKHIFYGITIMDKWNISKIHNPT
jgi:hypothetical protein